MCQLLGLSANKEVNINFSLKEFRHRGKDNPHGWGFAFLENNKWKVIKQPTSLANEDIEKKQFKFKSNIIVAHVRLASCGNQVHKNTHPFNKENWVFAHNGTVRKIKELPLEKYKPEGDTDSEYAFCYLLERIESGSLPVDEILEMEANEIKKLGRFNFLMSDGEHLYAYGDDRLYYVQRKAPFGFAKLKDDQYEVNLADIKAPDEQVIIVATEPLTSDEKWQKISGLMIFKGGKVIK